MATQEFCRFNKYGHCKFQETCRMKHSENICEKENCEISTCFERQPRECIYFRDFQRCKFGSFCSFKHKIPNDETFESLRKELGEVKSKLDKLEADLAVKRQQIEMILRSHRNNEIVLEINQNFDYIVPDQGSQKCPQKLINDLRGTFI